MRNNRYLNTITLSLLCLNIEHWTNYNSIPVLDHQPHQWTLVHYMAGKYKVLLIWWWLVVEHTTATCITMKSVTFVNKCQSHKTVERTKILILKFKCLCHPKWMNDVCYFMCSFFSSHPQHIMVFFSFLSVVQRHSLFSTRCVMSLLCQPVHAFHLFPFSLNTSFLWQWPKWQANTRNTANVLKSLVETTALLPPPPKKNLSLITR